MIKENNHYLLLLLSSSSLFVLSGKGNYFLYLPLFPFVISMVPEHWGMLPCYRDDFKFSELGETRTRGIIFP